MSPWCRKAIPVVVVLAILLPGSAVDAVDSVESRWQAQYAGRLPEYCKYTQTLPDDLPGLFGDTARGAQYRTLYGDDLQHLHHYCFAIWKTAAAVETVDPERRTSLYGQALREIDYVLQRASPTLALLPDLTLRRGVILMELERPLEAIDELTRALTMRADFPAAYVALSEYFERLDDLPTAVAVLRSGLRHSPDSGALRTRLTTLEERLTPGG